MLYSNVSMKGHFLRLLMVEKYFSARKITIPIKVAIGENSLNNHSVLTLNSIIESKTNSCRKKCNT